jgi:hypothetical protein
MIRKSRESFDVAIARMAVEAEEAGIEVRHYGRFWFATSQSDPQTLHRMTLVSCDCKGFMHSGRCKHLARLLDVTGNLPGRDDQPEPPAPVVHRCPECGGEGTRGIYGGHLSDYYTFTCGRCGGSGTLETEQPQAV